MDKARDLTKNCREGDGGTLVPHAKFPAPSQESPRTRSPGVKVGFAKLNESS